MNEPLETYTSEHFTAEIHHDEDMGDPFKEWDQCGILAFNPNSRDYRGDWTTWNQAEAAYYRIGLTIREQSGYVGVRSTEIAPGFTKEGELSEYDAILFTTRDRMREMHSKTYTPADAWQALRDELKTWKDWANRGAFGVVIKDANGNDVESCWGFLGYDSAEEPAREMLADAEAAYAIEQEKLATTGGWVII